jgi:hypothetical protein
MLEQTFVQPLMSAAKDMIPSWVSELAPHAANSRAVPLAGGTRATLDLYHGDDASMATAVVANAIGLSAEGLRESVAAVYEAVLGAMKESGFQHPVRMWSFVPGIHDRLAAGMDRYRLFNLGRYDAFARCLGDPASFANLLPAATAVGHFRDDLVVCTLGLRRPGVAIENPRQVPASAYSRAHGPRPPCFARAMVAQLPMGPRLLVSGTASIRGEDSVHFGSLPDQLDETFENLDRLVRSVDGVDRFTLRGVESARVYFPRATDRALLTAGVSKRLPESAITEFVPALICREELLVEIEAKLAPEPS